MKEKPRNKHGMAIVWNPCDTKMSSDSGFAVVGLASSEATATESDFTLGRVESDQDDMFAQHAPMGQIDKISESQPASHPPPSPPSPPPSRAYPARSSRGTKKIPPNPDELKISTGVVKAFGQEQSVTDQVDKEDAVLLNKVFHKSWEEPKEQMEQVNYITKSSSKTLKAAVYVATVRRKKKPAGWIAILATLPTLTVTDVKEHQSRTCAEDARGKLQCRNMATDLREVARSLATHGIYSAYYEQKASSFVLVSVISFQYISIFLSPHTKKKCFF